MITCSHVVRSAFVLVLAGLPLVGCSMHPAGAMSERTLAEPVRHAPEKAAKTGGDSILRLARLLCEQGRYEGALGVYAQLDRRGDMKPLELLEYANVAALVTAPRDTLVLFMRAHKALEDANVELSEEKAAELYTGLGRAHMAVGHYEAARRDLEKALLACPDAVAALNAMGVLLDARGDHEGARKMLSRANELTPSDARILNNLALSHLGGGDPHQAIRLFNQARSLSDSPSIKLNLAFTYFMDEQPDKTRSSLRSFMPAKQSESFMVLFGEMEQRVRDGESTVSEELLQAAGKLVEIQPPANVHGAAGGAHGQDAQGVSRNEAARKDATPNTKARL